MASRTGYVGTQNVGDVLTSSNFGKLPNSMLAEVTLTSPPGAISTVADVLTMTYTFVSGRQYVLHALFSIYTQNSSNGTVSFLITDNTPTQLAGGQFTITSTQIGSGFLISPRFTATGSQTYRMRMATTAGTVTANASSTSPYTFQLYDVGPSF